MWNLKYILISLSAVVVSFFIHELSHWICGELMGYEMKMTLNTVYPAARKYNSEIDYMIISVVGPMVTLIQTIVFCLIIRKSKNLLFFPFLFTAFYLALLSGIMNFSKPNDLGRISSYFELGLFAIPTVVVAIHAFLLLKTIKEAHIKRTVIWATVLQVMIFSSIWILTNQFFKVVLI